MKVVQSFKQGTLMTLNSSTRGVCFRVSYKWTSCQMRNEQFKFMGLNWTKTYAKQLQYLQEPDALREDIRNGLLGYNGWVVGVTRTDEYYLDHWGAKHGGIKSRVHRVQNVSDFLIDGMEQNFVYCFYGLKPDSSCWGHAVAFSSAGGTPKFFDANAGEFSFGAYENVGASIDQYCDRVYLGVGKTIEDRYVYDLYV